VTRLSLLAAALFLLSGCHTMTLEEARAACTRQGGVLVVIHTQKITLAGVGDEVASPGNCVSPDKFHDNPAANPAASPPPAAAN
jgi:hypothetical protein